MNNQYVGWKEVPQNLKTKTQLKKMKLKPECESEYVATIRYASPQGWKETVLYDQNKTIQIKSRSLNIDHLEMDDSNVAQALYNINKSAKLSRDTKQKNYYKRDFSTVSRAKTRQKNLYDLKENVMDKLIKEGRMKYLGYHVQINHYGESYLALYKLDHFTFHKPVYTVNKNDYLGNIDKIPSDKTIKLSLKFNESVKLLEKYMKEPVKNKELQKA